MRSLFVPTFIIVAAGLTTISAISMQLFWLQFLWVALGLTLLIVLSYIDLRAILNHDWIIWGFYAAVVGLLLIAYLTSPVIRNTRNWIVLGPLTFQPVELAKIALILVYARYFSRRHLRVASWRNILNSLAFFAAPAAIALLLPDLGSTLILFAVWFGFLLISGLPRQRIAVAVMIFAVVAVLGWFYFLADYQKARIRGLFYPEENALTINYSVIQSRIAIGSAGWWGKGYDQGTQTQLGFLTEPTNDFIIAALIEEWGIVIGGVVIGAFIYLILRILRVGFIASQNFEKFICLGVAIVFGTHFWINTGSALGLFPVVGVTFPFLSYGGSNILVSFLLLSMVNAIARRSYV